MPDFFTDNPILVIVIIFVLVRLLRGNKGKKTEEAPAVQQKQDGKRVRNSARRGRFDELKASLEDAMREADRQFSSATAPSPESVPEIVAPEMAQPMEQLAPAPSDPYAFHSVMNRQEQRSTDLSRANYDATAVDYDTAGDTFAFRSATRKPAEQEYHLSGFNSFRSAGGITSDPVRVVAIGDSAPPLPEPGPLPVPIDDPVALRQAIIVREILDKPLALRRR